MEYSHDVWARLGFRRNPLDPTPLGISDEERELLVGRKNEIHQFMTISSNIHGVIIVEGNIGVGKTSFVNAAQHDLLKKQFLPSHQTMEITEATEPSSLILSALSNLIYSLERIHGSNVCTKNSSLREGKNLVTSTIQSGWGGQFSILGTGGGIQRQPTIIHPPAPILTTMIQRFDEWIKTAIQKYSHNAGIIPVNNFDRLSDKEFIAMMNRYRDLVLLRPNILWVLIGPIGMFNTLENQARRVSEIVTGQPIILHPLSLEKVHEAIEVRVKNFAARSKAKLPIEKKFIDILYKVSDGEIRFIFKRLTDIIYEAATRIPSVETIPSDLAASALRDLSKRRLATLPLTKGDQTLLKRMAEGPFRIRDYKRFKLPNQQSLFKRVRRLMKLQILQSEKKSAKNVVYKTVADVNIFYESIKDKP